MKINFIMEASKTNLNFSNDCQLYIDSSVISLLSSGQFDLKSVFPSASFNPADDKPATEVSEPDEGECNISLDSESSSDLVSQAWFTTKYDRMALQSKGHQWKQGQWTKEEIDILIANIEQYCQQHDVTNPTEIIFGMAKDERKDFYRTIAKGLQRPLFAIYRRVIRMYDQKNYVGRYSAAEIKKLKELREAHGCDWATIGNLLGRSASSVKDRCRLMKDKCKTGKWETKEENTLCEVVYRLTGASPGDDITSGLSWAAVSEQVGTRSEKQCRAKWLNYLNWKQKGGIEWTRDDDISLLDRLTEVGAREEGDVNWDAIASDWHSARSPQWLRCKWWSLKRRVQDYNSCPFSSLLEAVRSVLAQCSKLKPESKSVSCSEKSICDEYLSKEVTVAVPDMVYSCSMDVGIDRIHSTRVDEASAENIDVSPCVKEEVTIGEENENHDIMNSEFFSDDMRYVIIVNQGSEVEEEINVGPGDQNSCSNESSLLMSSFDEVSETIIYGSEENMTTPDGDSLLISPSGSVSSLCTGALIQPDGKILLGLSMPDLSENS